ncbi:alpha/beta fold hydrolase [Catelliglobosispora koreensis]|uniref:alpha/beta hydrolase n=1 Tax=Catelliglobosispora koreensis TaxID=129052 RepID=UPI000379142F|nr:alpha/beta hydrolase [Catelliglobosispora koreensis]
MADDNSRPSWLLPARADGDPGKLALLIPGGGYSPDRPLLHFARAVFRKHGWSTLDVWWPHVPPQAPPGKRGAQRTWVDEQVSGLLDGETAAQIVLVGKSLGTLAAKTAADRGLAAIWLTPLINEDTILADLDRMSEPFLLVGGTADPSWNASTARSYGQPVCEIPGADHGLETDDDPANSALILRDVTVAMDRFVSTL